MTKKALILILFLGIISLPNMAFAQTELPFGGLATFTVPCPCSGTFSIWFTPLYLGGPVVLTGPMVYSPYSTIPYAYYFIGVPGIWHLGSYLPGVQACWFPSPVGCVPLPSVGLMTKVGTNKPF